MLTLIAVLAKEIGLPLAKKIISGLSNGKDAAGKFDQATTLINSGFTAVSAFQKAFGSDFEKKFSALVSNGASGWSYESGRADYMCIELIGDSQISISALLRDELNINLERINRVYGKNNPELGNYFLGLFGQWKDRYVGLLGRDDDAGRTFETIDSLLDGRKKTVGSALRMLQKTGLGATGALLVVYAGLIATSTGVGLFAWMSTALFGVPMLQVGGLALGGVGLVAVSRMHLSTTNAMSVAIASAYKLLDRRMNATTTAKTGTKKTS